MYTGQAGSDGSSPVRMATLADISNIAQQLQSSSSSGATSTTGTVIHCNIRMPYTMHTVYTVLSTTILILILYRYKQ